MTAAERAPGERAGSPSAAGPLGGVPAPDELLGAFAERVGDESPVAVEGQRTRWLVGGELTATARLLQAPEGVVDHRPEEMTVRVLAGTLVGDLEATLAAAGQRVALPDRGGTVGGALAVGEDHLDVPMRGRLRACALQARYVAADGRLVTAGGPTVKNVTGFDLVRLLVGSIGTLGFLGEVILRTQPEPARSLWLCAGDVDPFRVAETLRRRATVLWDRAHTWVHLEGHAVDVRDSAASLEGLWEEVDGPPPLPRHRWSLRPSELRQLRSGGPDQVVASVGVGTVFASAPQPPRQPDPVAVELGRRAKALFDPEGRLNPGRDPWRT